MIRAPTCRRISLLLRITLIVLLLIEALSFVAWTTYRRPNLFCGLNDGRPWVAWPNPTTTLPFPGPYGLTAQIRGGSFDLRLQRPYWLPRGPRYNIISLPLWPLLILNAGAVILTRRARLLPGHCPTCRYDLRTIPPDSNGQVSCPECGNSSKPTTSARDHPPAGSHG